MAVKIDLAKRTVTLAVGDLVAEAVASIGRVAGVSLWARMEMGRDAHTTHQRAQADQHGGYGREIAVEHQTEVDGFRVTIQGRIDGVIPARGTEPAVIEEVKSVVLPPLMFGAIGQDSYPHYVEQLRLYCFFVAQAGDPVVGRLIFVNVADAQRKALEIPGPFDDCTQLIATRVRALIAQATANDRQRAQRRASAAALAFPHRQPRLYQDQMMTAVQRALATRRHLLVSAPSGIGKTAGALYPAVQHALSHDQRVFFVTAKNTQHTQALQTLRAMGGSSAVAFRAREKMCINSVYACREEFCPHLQMFALKLERTNLRERLRARAVLDADQFIEAGKGASLCPFELALLEAERADTIVCDYNYVFDPQVYFRRFFQDRDYSDTILIVDEAHNLVARAMEYYSPSLGRRQIRDLLPHLRLVEPALAKAFRQACNRLEEFFRSMNRQTGDEYSQLDDEPPLADGKMLIDSPRTFFEGIKPEMNRLAVRYLLDKLTRGRAIPDDPIDSFLADFGQFCAVLALEGEEFAYLYDPTDGESVKIVCLDPSRQLRRRMEGFHSVIAMSATLEPVEFYQSMLGLDPARTDAVNYPSPFPRENRHIAVVANVLTTYRQRPANYAKVAEVIQTTVTAHRGHYMALFPSYEFLKAVAGELGAPVDPPRQPGIAQLARGVAELRPPFPGDNWRAELRDATHEAQLIIQRPNMPEPARDNLLASLHEPDPPKLILAVQGGVFAEGVDYPGELLCGVIVISPALPQVSFERELMRRYYDQFFGKGFEFAYLYPGMNRVIQSVGRLIRTETDQGVAVLVCQRFGQPQYRALFPADWTRDDRQLVTKDLAAGLRSFWEGLPTRATT